MVATSPRNRYRTRYKVSAEKPRSSELRLSPTRANCSNQSDFLSLFGLKKNIPQPKDTCIESSRLRLCSVVIMCSRCDICDRWFKSSWDAESHMTRFHDEFEMAIVRKSIMKRRNKARKGRSMDKENRTTKRNRLSRKASEDFELALRQFSDLTESAVAADRSQYNRLPKTSVKKSKKTVEFKPRVIKRPLLLPPNLLQARMSSPIIDDDSDDEIQFCCEVKYNRETTVQSDDDCEVVCEVVKDKAASTTPEPSSKYFQDPRISSTDSFEPGLRQVVDPSQLCYVVTRCNEQDHGKVVESTQENRSKVSSTSSSTNKFRAFSNNGRALPKRNQVFNYGRNRTWDRKIDAYIERWKKYEKYEKANFDDNEIVILQDHESSYDSYMNAGKLDNKQLECDSTDEIVILS